MKTLFEILISIWKISNDYSLQRNEHRNKMLREAENFLFC